jgi:peptidoglycan/xylan/chitin deacetylase (PgdA/CDA1 family)
MRFNWNSRLLNYYTARLCDLVYNNKNLEKISHILTFHHVSPNKGISTKKFRKRIKILKKKYEFVDLKDLNQKQNQLAITFDDGYKNFYQNAYPIIRDLEIPVTIFINSDLIGDRAPKKYRLSNLSPSHKYPLMNDAQIRELVNSDFVTIGNHTRTHHPCGEHNSEEVLKDEIKGGKQQLEQIFGISINSFAYPYGSYNETSRKIVEKSHNISVTTDTRPPKFENKSHFLPRVGGANPEFLLNWELSKIRNKITKKVPHLQTH